MAALIDEYSLKELEECLFKKRNELRKQAILSMVGKEGEPGTDDATRNIAMLIGGRDDTGVSKGRDAIGTARKKLSESHAGLSKEVGDMLPDYGMAYQKLRESGDGSIISVIDAPDEKYLDLYLLGREAIKNSVDEENHHEVKKYVDTLKFLIPQHNKVDLVEEIYGEDEKSKGKDHELHTKIDRVVDDVVKYAREAEFSEIVGSLKEYLGRRSGERGFPPIKLKELYEELKKSYNDKNFYKNLYEMASNWWRYQFSVKEFRDMRILVRRDPASPGLVDIAAFYEIERGPGDIVHGMSLFDDMKEDEIARTVPNPSPEYGAPKFISKREGALISGAAMASYILGLSKGVTNALSSVTLARIGLDIGAIGNISALKVLSLMSIAPSPVESILFYLVVLGGKRFYGSYKTYKGKRDAKEVLRSLAAHYDVDSIYALAVEVAKQQSLKARLCYSIIWKNGNQIDHRNLCSETKRYGLNEMETNRYLKMLKSKDLVKEYDGKYAPSGVRLQFIGHQIEMPLEIDNDLETAVDELVEASHMREPLEKPKGYVDSSIMEYRRKADGLEEGICRHKPLGIDTSAAEELLSRLKSEINQTYAYASNGNYFDAYLSLKGLKILLNNATAEYERVSKLQPENGGDMQKNC